MYQFDFFGIFLAFFTFVELDLLCIVGGYRYEKFPFVRRLIGYLLYNALVTLLILYPILILFFSNNSDIVKKIGYFGYFILYPVLLFFIILAGEKFAANWLFMDTSEAVLTGVKYGGEKFTRILRIGDVKELDLSNNQLVELDLTPLTRCKNLQKLTLDNNHLTFLDLAPLADCKELLGLSLKNNQLVELDLSPLARCTKLWVLHLSNNKLEDLGFSPLANCRELVNLSLDGNPFTGLVMTSLLECEKLVDLAVDKDLPLYAWREGEKELPPALERIKGEINWISPIKVYCKICEHIIQSGEVIGECKHCHREYNELFTRQLLDHNTYRDSKQPTTIPA
ncbi:MAG: leucine-rich repeat domain-containing protein [Candidatus Odinarchaeota archaeon]